jgi:uncharacterized protein (TIGR00297 family)
VTLWAAVLGSGLVAALGYRVRWLTGAAAAGATAVGTCVLWGGGLRGMALLGWFFASSGALTTWNDRRRAVPASRRTIRQVLANGWTAALGGLLVPGTPGLGWAVLAGGLAAAQADTWATEIGGLARRPPVLITTGRRVPPGTSGGITPLGTAAGIGGAVLLATLAWSVGLSAALARAAALGGTAGMLIDSLLGASVQAAYRCPRCEVHGETPADGCGVAASLVHGWRWMTNDGVNLMATGLGAATAVALTAAGGLGIAARGP